MSNQSQKHSTGSKPTKTTPTNFQDLIAATCDEIKELLLLKNREYGNSALQPLRIFSQAPDDEQIKVRIDDKLSRIKTLQNKGGVVKEDTKLDLIGYLIIHLIQERYTKDTMNHNEVSD